MATDKPSKNRTKSSSHSLRLVMVNLSVAVVLIAVIANLICLYSLVSAQRGSSIQKPAQDQQQQLSQQSQEYSEDVTKATKEHRLLLIAFGEDLGSESFERFNRSVRPFNLNLVALELDKSQDMSANEVGTSKDDIKDSPERRKFLQFKKALSTYRNEKNLIVMLVDGDNAIIDADEATILRKFFGFGLDTTKILIAADDTCWPDCSINLAEGSQYPKTGGSPYVNTQALIGYASTLWDILDTDRMPAETNVSQPEETLQTYLTRKYLDSEMREKYGLKLDHRSALLQTVHLDTVEKVVRLDVGPNIVRLRNVIHFTEPVIAISSDSSDVGSWIALNSLGNYLGAAWTIDGGCRDCNATSISLENVKDADLPTVLLGVFIEEATPFLGDFFEKLVHLSYPHSKIHLFIHNPIKYHDPHVKAFIENHGSKYASKELIDSNNERESMAEWQARDHALEKCVKLDCDYYFSLDSVARLEWSNSLKKLIEANRNVVAPMMVRPEKLWSTFWGAITPEGYYARSHDYVDIINGGRVGFWNVPHVMYSYLIKGSLLRRLMSSDPVVKRKPKLSFALDDAIVNAATKATQVLDQSVPIVKPPASLVFSNSLRLAGVYQHIINTHEFGHLIDPSHYNTSVKHPDFYQLKYNTEDWEDHYLHDKYMDIFDDTLSEFNMQKPCPDVTWFPLVNERFCRQLIDIMENFGQWSGGTNHDPRIEGGYESVPTRDIHMKQVGLQEMWLMFLKEYVMPVQLKEYIGYEHDPPRADLAFVVRYHPSEQASLRPHHDSSTYTLNIALNTPGIDYEGGGCKFIRYNCSVTQSRMGWALMHPGRLTHYHEGLPVTNGTRYIMVTFVDP